MRIPTNVSCRRSALDVLVCRYLLAHFCLLGFVFYFWRYLLRAFGMKWKWASDVNSIFLWDLMEYIFNLLEVSLLPPPLPPRTTSGFGSHILQATPNFVDMFLGWSSHTSHHGTNKHASQLRRVMCLLHRSMLPSHTVNRGRWNHHPLWS